jgi:mono/diheme cytochrome c family protein
MLKILFFMSFLVLPHSYADDEKTEKKSGHEASEDQIKSGKKVFQRKACGGCHKIGGEETTSVGPNLKDVEKRRDPKWVREWIKDPRIKQAANDPIYVELMKKYPTKMPYLKLSDSDIEDVLKYIESESKKKGK